MKRKIIFLHGFFASGACIPALTLKKSLEGKVGVLIPDLPLHPQQALDFILQLCTKEQPDLLVGNSNGSFLAQMVASRYGIPALLGNPHFEMTMFLSERIGSHKYKASRRDGRQTFIIDQPLIDEFKELQAHQWDYCRLENNERVWGLFGDNDSLAHYEPLFLKYYTCSYHFPGNHTPTKDEVEKYYIPLIMKMLTKFY